MLGSIPHQKFYFYHLPTRGRAGIKLGDAWYVSNVSIIFYCSMLLYYPSWMFYIHLLANLYHFLGLTYWHSAKCELLFSACFLHRRKSIPNGVQTQRNFLWIFLDQKTSSGPKKYQGGGPRWAQDNWARLEAQARSGGLCRPRWPPAPPLCSINTQYSRNPSGVDKNQFQPPQVSETPDPI